MNESNKPTYLEKGEVARLIPNNAPGGKEVKATSVLLSCLSAVDDFSKSFFQHIKGVRIGSRTKIECYTEVSFKSDTTKDKTRPDGLIVVKSGQTTWRALVESKIGKSDLEEQQVKNYLELAKRHSIDALITFSNQYVAVPTNHPIATLKKQDVKGVDLYHFSWASVITDALLCLKEMDGADKKCQKFILNEMIEYFNHPNASISNFDNMNQEWSDLCQHIRANATLSRDSDEVKNTVSSWHQETKDLSLIMSKLLGVGVTLNLSRKHQQQPNERLHDDSRQLADKHILACELDIPNTASSLRVKVDISRRTIECGMQLQAPEDRQTPKARWNWLIRQLQGKKLSDVDLRALAPRVKNSPQGRAAHIVENIDLFLMGDNSILPHSFDVILIRHRENQFGRSTFIKFVESAVQDFYADIGQHLKAWVPPAPRVEKSTENNTVKSEESTASDNSTHENESQMVETENLSIESNKQESENHQPDDFPGQQEATDRQSDDSSDESH